VVLAVVRRARGIRGEVVAEMLGSRPDRFQPGMRVFLGDKTAEIERSWVHDGDLVLKFRGIDTRTEAEGLRGSEVRIPIEERPPAPEGQYYLSDLVGCTMETVGGDIVGEITRFDDYGAAPLLTVKGGKGEILVPFTDAIYREIDLDRRRIVVELPEGLEDLNSE
jgi:16S rRNA processing protein RimM